MQEGEEGQKELGSTTLQSATCIGITACVREADDRQKWKRIFFSFKYLQSTPTADKGYENDYMTFCINIFYFVSNYY